MPNSLKRPVIDRISIVLRPADGQTLEQIAPFVQLGAHVSIGRGLAVITASCDRDAIQELHQAECQVVLAESAMRRGVILDNEAPTAEQSSVVADSPYAEVRVTNIDEWVTTVKNARRYEWLRARPLSQSDEVWIHLARNNSLAPARWALGADDPEGCDAAIDLAMRMEVEPCAD